LGPHTAKFSEDKHTLARAKQVFRFADHDPLLVPGVPRMRPGEPEREHCFGLFWLGGKLADPLPKM